MFQNISKRQTILSVLFIIGVGMITVGLWLR